MKQNLRNMDEPQEHNVKWKKESYRREHPVWFFLCKAQMLAKLNDRGETLKISEEMINTKIRKWLSLEEKGRG